MQIGKLDNSFLTLSSKENLLTCRLEGAHWWFSSQVLWGYVLSSPRKIIPVQGASTVCMRDTYYSQKNFPFSSQGTDEIPLGFWFIQGYFFFNRQSRVLLWRKNKSAAGFRLCTTTELTRLAQRMSLTKTGRSNGRHPGVSRKRQKRTEVPSIVA